MGEYAGCESDADADEQRPERGEGQGGGRRIAVNAGLLASGGRRRSGVGFNTLCRFDGAQRHRAGFRRVTETGFSAALVRHAQRRARCRLLYRDRHAERVTVDFAFAEELIFMRLASG
ncbi:hypothetical protein CSE899_11637 [Cronobacter sakazakii E899]|nr:hypothetical protein CSE899_11637 [Cronobacter sakazakii E899]